MGNDTKKVLEAALRLPETERLRLAERLLATLGGEPDGDSAEVWEMEIARRSREIEQGLVKPIPWCEVKEAARKARGGS
jgi:putative addiction module component (TIGR02574 family)